MIGGTGSGSCMRSVRVSSSDHQGVEIIGNRALAFASRAFALTTMVRSADSHHQLLITDYRFAIGFPALTLPGDCRIATLSQSETARCDDRE